MAITLVGTAKNTSTGTNVTVDLGVLYLQQGDVLIGAVDSITTTDQTISEGSGTWAKLADLYSNDTNDCNLGVFRKVMGASPDSSVTFDAGASNQSAIVMAFRGVDNTTPEDAATTTATGTNSGSANPPAITTVTNNAVVVAIGASTESTPSTPTVPANYTNLDFAQASATSSVMMAIRTIASSGTAENPAAFGGIAGSGTDSWAAASVCLRPASLSPNPDMLMSNNRRMRVI